MSGTNDDKNNDKNNQPGAGGDDPNPNPGGDPNGNPGGDGGENNHQDPNQNPGGNDGDAGGDDFDYSDPEKVKKELKKLRRENASRRVSAKEANEKLAVTEEQLKKIKQTLGLEEEESPEDKIAALTAERDAMAMEMQLNSIAGELEIPAKGQKYFKFLVGEKLNELEEGEELTDEDLEEIAQEVKGMGGSTNKPNSTGLGGKKNPPPGSGDSMTVEQFAKMSLTEKSQLYTKNPKEYDRLFSAAKEKGLV